MLYDSAHNASSPDRSKCRELPVKIIQIREAFSTLFRAAFQEVGLTDPQWRVLRVLSSVNEIDVGTLATRAMLLGPSLSRILKDLTARGLITRRISWTDGRRNLHSITPEGMQLINTVIPKFDPIYDGISDHMSEDEINIMSILLEKFRSTLEELTSDEKSTSIENSRSD